MLVNYIDIVSFQKEEIPALIIKGNPLTVIDLMRIYDNITLSCLPENFFKHNHWKATTLNQIMKYLSRSYTWQLISVSNHNQSRSHTDCT